MCVGMRLRVSKVCSSVCIDMCAFALALRVSYDCIQLHQLCLCGVNLASCELQVDVSFLECEETRVIYALTVPWETYIFVTKFLAANSRLLLCAAPVHLYEHRNCLCCSFVLHQSNYSSTQNVVLAKWHTVLSMLPATAMVKPYMYRVWTVILAEESQNIQCGNIRCVHK